MQDGSNFNPETLPKVLRKAHERLLNVQLECLPYQDILRKYDRSFYVLFILIRHISNRPYYKFNLGEKDYVEMAGLSGKPQGKVLAVPE